MRCLRWGSACPPLPAHSRSPTECPNHGGWGRRVAHFARAKINPPSWEAALEAFCVAAAARRVACRRR